MAVEVAALQPGEPVPPRRAGHHHALHERGYYIVPKLDALVAATIQSSPAEPPAGELDGLERNRGTDAGPSTVRLAPNITVNLACSGRYARAAVNS